MKKLITIIALFFLHFTYGQAQCDNSGFEQGTSGYSFRTQNYPTTWSMYNNFPTNTSGTLNQIVSNNLDTNTGLPMVASGDYAMRINYDNDPNYGVTSLKKAFQVAQSSVSFKYSVVLSNVPSGTNHPTLNSYFQYRLLNSSGTAVLYESHFDYTSPALIQSTLNGDVKYSNWTCATINTNSLIGTNVILEIIVADCGDDGHFGYAYLDDICGVGCSVPSGRVDLRPVQSTCPSFPLVVGGSYIAPAGATSVALFLDVLNSDNVIVSTVNLLAGSPNPFTVNLNQGNFAALNDTYEFRLKGIFTFPGGGTTTLTDLSANGGHDVNMLLCCPSNLTLTSPIFDVISPDQDNRQSWGTITASNLVNSGAAAIYHANSSVTLTPGFNAISGSSARIYVAGCTNTFIGKMMGDDDFSNSDSKSEDSKNVESDFFKIVPNPNTGLFSLIFNDFAQRKVTINDIFGRTIYELEYSRQKEFDIDISNHPKGIYILEIITPSGKMTQRKLIKN